MSSNKQSHPARHKLAVPLPSASTAQSTLRSLHAKPIDAAHSVQGRNRLGPASTFARSVSTRTQPNRIDNSKMTHNPPQPPSRLQPPQSTSILKRSLSKLRIRDQASPDSSGPKAATHSSSKIPQAAAPTSSTRIVRGRPVQSAFVVHDISPSHSKPQSRLPRQHVTPDRPFDKMPQRTIPSYSPSPSATHNNQEVRTKAMQLGIFKITETDLKQRFQFLNEIGAGEWGSVWTVEALRPLDHLPSSAYRKLQVVKLTGSGTYTIDNTPNFRPLAVKLCKRESKSTAAARTQRLWNEFKVLRTLMDQLPRAEQVNADSPNCRVRNDRTGWHPNVVNFHEFLLTPTLAMLVMPKFDEPMKVCLGEAVCRNYFQQLLSAVHWLHQYGICHNDIKVDNLGVTYDTSGLGRDVVTLFDFGFANRYDPAKENAFMSKEVWGTPEYLAPERFRSLLHDERKTDVWALGITFFEMLTGRTPFEHHDEKFDSKEKFQVYYARAERGTWLGQWDLAPDLEDLIRKMLHHDPQERIDAGGALFQGNFDRRDSGDSLDQLLQLSYEHDHTHQATDCKRQETRPIASQDLVDDSDVMIRELVAETERNRIFLSSRSDEASQLASPGVSRAAVATHLSPGPDSPSLSQVGMDSRLTELMCVSPPWRGQHPSRQGTPIPSAHRDRLLAESLKALSVDEAMESGISSSHSSPISVSPASGESIVRDPAPAARRKESPFRLRLGQRQNDNKATRPIEEQLTSTPLSAPGAPQGRANGLPLPKEGATMAKQPARSEAGSRGNLVASLAKKFDASNFLARPPPHHLGLAGQGGLGLSVGFGGSSKIGHGHRRSKSYNIASSRPGVSRLSMRRSTGSIAHGISHADAAEPEPPMPECARRLFRDGTISGSIARKHTAVAQLDSATDVGSARSDTKNAGPDIADTDAGQRLRVADVSLGRTPALHAVLCGSESSGGLPMHASETSRAVSMGGSSPDDEVIFHKLKRMASLAGMLSRMIDETQSSMLSPARSAATPERRWRASSGASTTTEVDISPGLLSTPPSAKQANEEADVSLVSAAFSLDLGSSVQRRSEAVVATPSAQHVESMYTSFLLSQKVGRSGEGFLSPTAPAQGGGSGRPRSLAALFAPTPASTPSHENQASPTRTRNKSAGRTAKLARLFRMH